MLDRRGKKVSRSKTEYMHMKEKEARVTMKLQGTDVVKVDTFKYVGLTIQCNGQYTRGGKKSVGWVDWVEMSVMRDV